MPNSVALAEKFLPVIDEIYKKGSVTSILDTANEKIKWLGGNKVELFKITVPGLGDYSRNGGFATGSVTGAWEPHTLAYDRGRSISVDAMDDEETLGMCFASTAGEFVRTREIPEIDAIRFSKYAQTSGITTVSADITVGTTDCVGLLDAAEETMGDAEVPTEGRVLFVSEKFYRGIKHDITRYTLNGENGINRVIEMWNNMPVIRVPKTRFNTKIELLDGTSEGETDGGYTNVPTVGSSYAINFMIVDPSAVIQPVKHRVPRIWTPAQNQNADAYKFDLRVYHDAFVLANKVKGIYVHKANTANS